MRPHPLWPSALGALLFASVALADDSAAEAKRLFDLGLAELRAGHNEEALDAFMKSRALKNTRLSTQNAALTLKRLGRYDEALELLRNLLVAFPNMTAAQREAAVSEVEALESSTGLIQVESADTGATVFVGGRAQGQVPLSSPVRVNPGQHSVRIERGGQVLSEILVRVAARETVRVRPARELPRDEEQSRPGSSPKPTRSKPKAMPAAPKWHRLRLGIGAGALIPAGTLGQDAPLADYAQVGFALEGDAGYSIHERFELGAFYSLGVPQPGPRCEVGAAGTSVTCRASTQRAGLGLVYLMKAQSSTVIPYAGLALGYDRFKVTREVTSSSGMTEQGFDDSSVSARSALGMDVATSPTVMVGPRIMASLGQYNEGATHFWLELGARLSLRVFER